MPDMSLRPRPGRFAPGLALALLGCLLAATPALAEILYNPMGWKFPNLNTAAKMAIHPSDRTPEIPGKETIVKGWRRSNGTGCRTYEIEGKIFGVEIDEDGKPPFEYSIMDADGDGKFETKIVHSATQKDHAYVPKWVIDHYFKLHPEVERGPGGVPAMPNLNAAAAPPPVPDKKKAAPPPAKKKPGTPSPAELDNP